MKTGLSIILSSLVFVVGCGGQQKSDASQSHAVATDSLTLVDPLVEVPKFVVKPKAIYPDSIKLKNRLVVIVRATVDTLGNVSDVAVVHRTGTVFDTLAIHLAQQFKFTAGRIDNRASIVKISWGSEFIPR
jgi:TonB family protein